MSLEDVTEKMRALAEQSAYRARHRKLSLNTDQLQDLFQALLQRGSLEIDDSIPKDFQLKGFQYGEDFRIGVNPMIDIWVEAEGWFNDMPPAQLVVEWVDASDFYFDASDDRTWLKPDQRTYKISVVETHQ